jgi:dihydrofolate reductase
VETRFAAPGRHPHHGPSHLPGNGSLLADVNPKVVFSHSLASADWPESRIARGDLAEEIDALRAEPGGDIMAHGGATFVQALSRQRLIDEYRLVIRPVALGHGLPMFKDLAKPLPLSLVSATTYLDGTAIHVYRPRP